MKEFLAFILNLFSGKFSDKASILMYHSISNNDRFSTVTPEKFEKQLIFLQRNGYTILSLEDLIKRLEKGESIRGCVCLTFDDGNLDFYTEVFPRLRKYKMHATLFLPTGLMDPNDKNRADTLYPMLNKKQVIEMSKSGYVAVMAHTVNHKKLTTIGFDEAVAEIEKSRDEIEFLTGKTAPIFAYPSGKYSNEIVAYLAKKGTWKAAVTVVPGLVANLTNPFLLPRNSIDSSVGIHQFKMKVTNALNLFMAFKS